MQLNQLNSLEQCLEQSEYSVMLTIINVEW